MSVIFHPIILLFPLLCLSRKASLPYSAVREHEELSIMVYPFRPLTMLFILYIMNTVSLEIRVLSMGHFILFFQWAILKPKRRTGKIAQSVQCVMYDGLSMGLKHPHQITVHYSVYITLILLCKLPNGLGVTLALGGKHNQTLQLAGQSAQLNQ